MKWLDETFKKKEGFTTGCGGGTTSTCDRLKFLTCTTNFNKLNDLITNATNLNNLATNATNLINLATNATNLINLVNSGNYDILQRYINADIIDINGNIDTKDRHIHTNVLYVQNISVRPGHTYIGIQSPLDLGNNSIEAGDILSRTGMYKVSGNDFHFFFNNNQRLSFSYDSSESKVGKKLQIIDKKEHNDWNYFRKLFI